MVDYFLYSDMFSLVALLLGIAILLCLRNPSLFIFSCMYNLTDLQLISLQIDTYSDKLVLTSLLSLILLVYFFRFIRFSNFIGLFAICEICIIAVNFYCYMFEYLHSLHMLCALILNAVAFTGILLDSWVYRGVNNRRFYLVSGSSKDRDFIYTSSKTHL